MKKILIGLLLGFTLSAYSQTDNILNVVDNKYKRYIYYMERGNKRLAENELNALVKSLYNVVAMMYDDQTAGGSSQAHFKARIDAIFGATFPFPTFSYDAEVNYDSVKVQSELAVSGIVGGLRDTLSYHEDSISSISGRSLEAIDSVKSIVFDNMVHWDSISSISARSLATLDSVKNVIFENIVQWDSINKVNDSIRVQYSTLQILRDSITALRNSISGMSPTPSPTYYSFSDTVLAKNFSSKSQSSDHPWPYVGTIPALSEDTAVTDFNQGSWISFKNYQFVNNTNRFKMYHVMHPDYGSDFEIRLDNPDDGFLVSTFTHEGTGSWVTGGVQTVELDEMVSGTQDVYIKSLGHNNGSIYWIYFYHEEVGDTSPPVINSLNVYDTAKAVIYGTTNEGLETFTYAGWTISADSGAVTVTSGDMITSTSFNLNVSRDFKYDEDIELSYSQSTGNVADSAGLELADLTKFVNNGVESSVIPEDTVYSADTIYFKHYDAYDGWRINRYYSSIDDTVVDDFVPSGWLRYDDVEFNNVDSISLRYARDNHGNEMQFRINSSDGTLIADPTMPYTTDSLTFSTITFPTTTTLNGTYDLYVISEGWNGCTMWYMFWGGVSVTDTSDHSSPGTEGGDYYFSSINGSDSNDGTSASEAWQTIDKLNSILPQLNAGDQVLFEKGSVWYESEINMNNVNGSSDNPIVFRSYGTGDMPKITGAKNVSGLFTDDTGDEWYVEDIDYSLSGYLRTNAGLLINGNFNDIARYPNDGSWWTTPSTGKTSLSDSDQSWSTDEWVGSNVVARCVPYGVEISEITSNTSTNLNFESFKYYSLRQSTNPTYYYITNANQGLSEDGEWTYRDDTLRVYYTSNLNAETVEFPVVDTVFKMTGSSFIVFDGMKFESANAIIVHLDNSDNVTFQNCTIRLAGNTGIRTRHSTDLVLSNNYLEYFHENGVAMDNGGSTITDNVFKNMSAVWGHNNTAGSDLRSGAAITPWYSTDYNYIKYNVFDSISQAMNSHSNSQTWYFERNLVKNFGVSRGGDIGAIYTGGDWMADVPKYVRKNIFINGIQDLNTITGGHATRYTHMIYWDYSSRGIVVDSNTVDGVSVALYANCAEHNRFQDNLVVDATRDLDSFWNSVFYFDASGDNTGCDGISDNIINRNTIVFGNHNNQKGTIWRIGDDEWFPNFTFDENTYQNSFDNTIVDHIKVVGYYTSSQTYTMSQMCSSFGWDCSSVSQPLSHTYADVSGITEDEFIKVVYNASKITKTLPLEDTYIDLDGNTNSTGEIELGPYETKVLFYVSDGTD